MIMKYNSIICVALFICICLVVYTNSTPVGPVEHTTRQPKALDSASPKHGNATNENFCSVKSRSKCQPIEPLKFCAGENNFYITANNDYTIRFQRRLNEHIIKTLGDSTECWNAIQPFVCAMMYPKCETIDGSDMVLLPTIEMCKSSAKSCEGVSNSSSYPEFLKCVAANFPFKCQSGMQTEYVVEELECSDSLEVENLWCTSDIVEISFKFLSSILTLILFFTVTVILVTWDKSLTCCFSAYGSIFMCASWLGGLFPGECNICRFLSGMLKFFNFLMWHLEVFIVLVIIVFVFGCLRLYGMYDRRERLVIVYFESPQDHIECEFIGSHLFSCAFPLTMTFTALVFLEASKSFNAPWYLDPLCVAGFSMGFECFVGYQSMYRMLSIEKRYSGDLTYPPVDRRVVRRIYFMKMFSLFLMIESCVILFAYIYTEVIHPGSLSKGLSSSKICGIISAYFGEESCRSLYQLGVLLMKVQLVLVYASGIWIFSFLATPRDTRKQALQWFLRPSKKFIKSFLRAG